MAFWSWLWMVFHVLQRRLLALFGFGVPKRQEEPLLPTSLPPSTSSGPRGGEQQTLSHQSKFSQFSHGGQQATAPDSTWDEWTHAAKEEVHLSKEEMDQIVEQRRIQNLFTAMEPERPKGQVNVESMIKSKLAEAPRARAPPPPAASSRLAYTEPSLFAAPASAELGELLEDGGDVFEGVSASDGWGDDGFDERTIKDTIRSQKMQDRQAKNKQRERELEQKRMQHAGGRPGLKK